MLLRPALRVGLIEPMEQCQRRGSGPCGEQLASRTDERREAVGGNAGLQLSGIVGVSRMRRSRERIAP